ncbi:hypothetical protein ACJZ2D_011890 [Fusarium nematophilum]
MTDPPSPGHSSQPPFAVQPQKEPEAPNLETNRTEDHHNPQHRETQDQTQPNECPQGTRNPPPTMTDSPPREPRARSKSPPPPRREEDSGPSRAARDDSFRGNSDRRDQRDRPPRRDRSRSRDRDGARNRRDSPPRRPRDRSRSPARRPRGSGGFRWKGDRRENNDRNRDFRRRSPQRHRDRDFGGGRDRDFRRDDRDRGYRRDDRDRGRGDQDRNRDRDRDQDQRKEKKDKDKAKAPAVQAGQEMIIVNVNDRLGTKAAVPCLGSDTVGQLKMMVAARIGRDPGQIILKRQSERPFKDHITLDDYGVSNGVQLDLEIDTRD